MLGNLVDVSGYVDFVGDLGGWVGGEWRFRPSGGVESSG